MAFDQILIFILPLCDFSLDESQKFSIEELNKLWTQGKITKYRFHHFMKDINDDYPADNTNNRIVIGEENLHYINV
jgi:hypothetical protein